MKAAHSKRSKQKVDFINKQQAELTSTSFIIKTALDSDAVKTRKKRQTLYINLSGYLIGREISQICGS